MARTRQTRKKPEEPTASVEERLAAALSQGPFDESQRHTSNIGFPHVGDQVTLRDSDTIYLVTLVSPGGREVNLSLPGTNLQRYRVSVDDLNFKQRTTQSNKPIKPKWTIAQVQTRVDDAKQVLLEQLDQELLELSKYLKSKDVPNVVSGELDKLREEVKERWQEMLDRLPDLLEEES